LALLQEILVFGANQEKGALVVQRVRGQPGAPKAAAAAAQARRSVSLEAFLCDGASGRELIARGSRVKFAWQPRSTSRRSLLSGYAFARPKSDTA
jgi:hypothetical protein